MYREKDKPGTRIATISLDELSNDRFIEKITGESLSEGKKSMRTKLEVAREAAQCGIETRIIDGITSTINNHQYWRDYAGTTVEARK